jgi:adenosylcobinamide-GDP ribazoletransferase
MIAILLRVSALAALSNPAAVAMALIAAHGAARAALPPFMLFVPAARSDGLSQRAGAPPVAGVAVSVVLGLVLLAGLGHGSGIEAALLVGVTVIVMAWLCLAQIGGQTGDVLGALEQACEIVILLAALH